MARGSNAVSPSAAVAYPSIQEALQYFDAKDGPQRSTSACRSTAPKPHNIIFSGTMPCEEAGVFKQQQVVLSVSR